MKHWLDHIRLAPAKAFKHILRHREKKKKEKKKKKNKKKQHKKKTTNNHDTKWHATKQPGTTNRQGSNRPKRMAGTQYKWMRPEHIESGPNRTIQHTQTGTKKTKKKKKYKKEKIDAGTAQYNHADPIRKKKKKKETITKQSITVAHRNTQKSQGSAKRDKTTWY